jgi:hypothetical protein
MPIRYADRTLTPEETKALIESLDADIPCRMEAQMEDNPELHGMIPISRGYPR